MNPGLREHKGAALRVVICTGIPEDMRTQVREITSLESSNPRKGHATTLLWTVCHEADEALMTLILQPKHFGDGEFDDAKLQKFYSRFGFVKFQDHPVVLMARSPDTAQRVVTLQ